MIKILKERWLTFPPHECLINPGQIEIDSFKERKINEMFNPKCICFADIPPDELKIHMDKYGDFGIAFHKSFLIEKGANPVFYIEDNSSTYKWNISSGKYELTKRTNYYQECCSKTIFYFFQQYLRCCKNSEELRDTWEILYFLINVFSHFKVWNNSLEENHPDNYYFEREWRATNNINFQLSDIVMIIIPKTCEKQFKIDFPEYTGEFKFID